MEDATDRIARPWGARVPYGRHETWPARVDTFLAEGVEPEAVQRWVQSASILHSDGDAWTSRWPTAAWLAYGAGTWTGSTGGASARRTCSAGRPTPPVTG